MSILTYPHDKFEDRITKNAVKHRVPIQGEIEITSLCNFRCIHCYVNKGSDEAQENNFIVLPLFKDICDELRSCGCIWLLITGGEPLIHPNFLEMWEYASKLGLKLSLFTNGSLLTESHFDLFSKFPPESIEISIYSLKPDIYNVITKYKIIPTELIAKIKDLSSIVKSVYLKTPLLKQNYDEVPKIQEVAKNLNIGFRMDAIIHPSIHGSNEPTSYRIPNKTAANMAMNDAEMKKQLKESFLNDNLPFDSSSCFLPCSAGIYSFHISCDSKVNICSIYRNKVVDLNIDSFKQGWEKLKQVREKPKIQLNNECDNCKLKIICPHCPAIPLLHNEKEDFIDDYVCNYTKNISQLAGIIE